jgi:hypothetical protein
MLPDSSPNEAAAGESTATRTTVSSSGENIDTPATAPPLAARGARHVLVAQAAVGATSVVGHTVMTSSRANDGQLMAATLTSLANRRACKQPPRRTQPARATPRAPRAKPRGRVPEPVEFVPRPLPPAGAASASVAWIQELGQFANDLA